MKKTPMLPTTLRNSYAKKLKSLREQSGMTQEALARVLGVHKSFVSQVERAVENLSIDTYERFIGAFSTASLDNGERRLREQVGLRLRTVREGLKISQEALGGMAGFSVVFVGRVERGDVSTSLDQIELLAQILETDPARLIEGPNGTDEVATSTKTF